MNKVIFEDLGNMPYSEAWAYQERLNEALVAEKVEKRLRDTIEPAPTHHLLFVEHPHVYTLGKSGSENHLLLTEAQLVTKNIEFFKINRGGDITYHGFGQIVGYPIFDLDYFFNDVHKYVRLLEEAVMLTCAEFGLETYRESGYTGVWLPATDAKPKRKICAIGVHMRRWITLHGFAFNVNTDLDFFKNIVPCGINEPDRDVTSLRAELGHDLDLDYVKSRVKHHLSVVFEYEYI